MNGIQIEYFLGILFTIAALGHGYPLAGAPGSAPRGFTANYIWLILGIVLIVFAISKLSPIN